jgi:hypothetical protein
MWITGDVDFDQVSEKASFITSSRWRAYDNWMMLKIPTSKRDEKK